MKKRIKKSKGFWDFRFLIIAIGRSRDIIAQRICEVGKSAEEERGLMEWQYPRCVIEVHRRKVYIVVKKVKKQKSLITRETPTQQSNSSALHLPVY